MLGFHRRTRSLIPVKDLAKYDKVCIVEEEEDEDLFTGDGACAQSMSDLPSTTRARQLMLVYMVFLAEA